MRKWKIETVLSSPIGYGLIHNKKLGISINWFQKVKIDKFSINLYDNQMLSTYYSKKVLPKYIINELQKLPKR